MGFDFDIYLFFMMRIVFNYVFVESFVGYIVDVRDGVKEENYCG